MSMGAREVKPILRAVRPEDSEFVFQVKKEVLEEYVRQTWGWDERFQRELDTKTYDPTAIRIISWRDMDVGWLEVRRVEEQIQLAGIYIRSEYQSRGIGSGLIKDIISEADEQRLPVTLQVLKVNRGARRLYERMGFVSYGETKTHTLMKLVSSES